MAAADRSEAKAEAEGFTGPSQEETASLWGLLSYTWLTPFLDMGSKQILTAEDLWPLRSNVRSVEVQSKFWEVWEEEKKKPNPSLLKATFSQVIRPALLGLLCAFGYTFLPAMSPLILRQIIFYLEDKDAPYSTGIMWCVVLFLSSALQSILVNQMWRYMLQVAIVSHSALMSAIYKKALLISNQVRAGTTAGQLVNYISVDLDNIFEFIPRWPDFMIIPFQLLFCIGFLFYYIGWATLAGIAVMVITVPTIGFIIVNVKLLSREKMTRSDDRLKITTDVLQGIRFVKMASWEESFLEKIDVLRNIELGVLSKLFYTQGGIVTILSVLANFVFLAAIAVYAGTGGAVVADIIYPSAAFFALLSMPLARMPILFVRGISALVSVRRIQSFMESEEREWRDTEGDRERLPKGVLAAIDHGTFSWFTASKEGEEDAAPAGAEANAEDGEIDADNKDKPNASAAVAVEDEGGERGSDTGSGSEEAVVVLRDINMSVAEGSITMIIGPVGSGKSTLLEALLGHIRTLEGEVLLGCSVGYVAQQPWIMNATVRDNIVFGKPFDEGRYEEIIDVCCLRTDLDILESGDMTEIGERGINISGGQKQRIALARALYADPDLYVMDDPTAAVDAHTAKDLYDGVIMGFMKKRGKTLVMTTNHLQMLPGADHVIVLADTGGTIAEEGSYDELIGMGLDFSELIAKHGAHKGEDGSEDDVSVDGGDAAGTGSLENTVKEERGVDGGDGVGETLINEEDRNEGATSWSLFKRFFFAGNSGMLAANVFVGFLTLLSYILFQVWLSLWTESYFGKDKKVSFYILTLLAISFGTLMLTALRETSFVFYMMTVLRNVHRKFMNAVIFLPVSFFDTNPIGRVVNRLSKDLMVVDSRLVMMTRFFIMLLTGLAAGLIICSVVTVFLPVVLIPGIYAYFHYLMFYRKSARELQRIEAISHSPVVAHYSESLDGLNTIWVYGQYDSFVSKLNLLTDRHHQAFYLVRLGARWLDVRMGMIGALFIMFSTLGVVILRDWFSVSLYAVALNSIINLTLQLGFLVLMTSEVENCMTNVERLFDYADLKGEREAATLEDRVKEGWPTEGAIVAKDVTLRYREGLELALTGVNFSIRGGEKIGVVGRTGAGKSTLIQVLLRLVPYGGRVEIDGVDITTLSLPCLRSSIAVIPQNPTMFDGSVRFNLDPLETQTDEKIWEVLELVNLDEYVEGLEGKLDYNISEGGGNLSVGQRQLVCIARVLLVNARIVLLDEATASVDVETDELIQNMIRTRFADRTVVTVAHRLHTILDSDRIMVMDKGKVAAFDSPAALLADPGSIFAKLARDAGITAANLAQQQARYAVTSDGKTKGGRRPGSKRVRPGGGVENGVRENGRGDDKNRVSESVVEGGGRVNGSVDVNVDSVDVGAGSGGRGGANGHTVNGSNGHRRQASVSSDWTSDDVTPAGGVAVGGAVGGGSSSGSGSSSGVLVSFSSS